MFLISYIWIWCIYYLYYDYLLVCMESFFSDSYKLTLLHIHKI